MKTSTVLVTGGAGYIGSVCCAQLLDHGYSVVVIDDLSTGFKESIPSGAAFYQVNIGDREKLRSILFRHAVDVVFHFAAKALIPESVTSPGSFFEQNVAYGIAMLEELRRVGVHRFVFSSTAAVYGDPHEVPIPEEHPKNPVNSYGESKLMFERILEWYARAYDWGVAVLRYFNACGAWLQWGERHHPETHIIPLLLQAASGKLDTFNVFGTDYPTKDGTCIRDYVHVIDIADAHIRAMELLENPGMTTFNIGTGNSYSVNEVLHVVETITGQSIRTRSAGRRPGDPAVLCANSDKLVKALGWRPKHSDLKTIVETAWTFHKSLITELSR